MQSKTTTLVIRKCSGKNCKNTFRCFPNSPQEFCRTQCNPNIDPFTGFSHEVVAVRAKHKATWQGKRKIDKPGELKLIERLRYLYTETKLTALQISKLMTEEGFVSVTGKALNEPWVYMNAKRIGICKWINDEK